MSVPGYEEDVLAQMFMAHGQDGTNCRLKLTSLYINNLVGFFSTEIDKPLDLIIAIADELNNEFMILKEKGHLEGKSMNQSYA